MGVEQFIQLGIAGVALILMYNLVNKSMDSNKMLAESIDKNTTATNELYTYVKVRNGTLERLVQGSDEVKQAAKAALETA